MKKGKQPFKSYLRICDRCEKPYNTPHKHSKICHKCDKRKGGGSYKEENL